MIKFCRALATCMVLIQCQHAIAQYSATNDLLNVTRNTALKRLKDSCLLPDEFRTRDCCLNASDWDALRESGRVASSRCEFDYETLSFPCAIKLGINNWDASFADAYIAKVFIEEYLGWPVEIMAESPGDGTVSEHNILNDTGGIVELGQWELLSRGLIDVLFEVWPSGHIENQEEFIQNQETVVNAGELGVSGRIGWVFPSFLLTNQSLGVNGDTAFIEYWRSLLNNADVFKDPESLRPCCQSIGNGAVDQVPCIASAEEGGTPVALGGYANSSVCDSNPSLMVPTYGGRFLAGHSTWVQKDDSIISNLGLNFTIEFALSEAQLISEMQNAVDNNDPLLMYLWRPHGAFDIMNLTSMILPSYGSKCAELDDEDYNCGYPDEELYKVYSKRIENVSDVVTFLEEFELTENIQEGLLGSFLRNSSSDWNDLVCQYIKEDVATGRRSRIARLKRDVDREIIGSVWNDEEPQAVVQACECSSDNKREVVEYFVLENPSADVVFVEDASVCGSDRSSGNYYYRWSNLTYNTTMVEVIECDYIAKGSLESIIALGVSSLSYVLAFIFLLLVMGYRKSDVFKGLGILGMVTLLFACILLSVSAFYYSSLEGERTHTYCFVTAALFSQGAILFIGSLFIQQYFLLRLYSAQSKKGSRPSYRLLWFQVAGLVLLAGLLTFIHWYIEGFDPIEEPVTLSSGQQIMDLVCPFSETILGVYLSVFAIILSGSIYLSSFSDRTPGIMDEARYIKYVVFNTVLVAGIGALAITQRDGSNHALETSILSITITWIIVFAIVFLAGPKIYYAITKTPVENLDNLVHRRHSMNQTSVVILASETATSL